MTGKGRRDPVENFPWSQVDARLVDVGLGTLKCRCCENEPFPVVQVACATRPQAMAGVPLANGFLSKEMFFGETLALNAPGMLMYATPVAATIAAIASVVYSTRFIHDIFFNGKSIGLDKVPHEPPRFMRVPVNAVAR